jgi:hypothetical protein
VVGKKEDKKTIAKVFSCLSLIAAAVLVVIGVVCCKAGNTIVAGVNKGLVEQKIYFPPAAAATAFPDTLKYAGQQVDNGTKAKAYADDFLKVQLKMVGNGKTTFEVGSMAAADPQNTMLQQQQAAMFQIDTSRSLLLVGAYGAAAQGTMLKNIGMVMLAGSGVLLIVGTAQWMRYKKI